MKVLVCVALFATTVYAEPPVYDEPAQRYYIARPAEESGPYPASGWRPDGPAFLEKPQVGNYYLSPNRPRQLSVSQQQQLQQQQQNLGPVEVEVEFAPSTSSAPQQLGVQQFQPQSRYNPPGNRFGAPNSQLGPSRDYDTSPVRQFGALAAQQQYLAPRNRYNAPTQSQFGANPQGEAATPKQFGSPNGQNYYSAPTQQAFGASAPDSQYGAPANQQLAATRPSNQYGAPANQQFAATRPNGQYGAPANQQLGASSPSTQYGAPTSQQSALSSPSNQYGAPVNNQFSASNPNAQFGPLSKPQSNVADPDSQYGAPANNQFGVAEPSNQYSTPVNQPQYVAPNSNNYYEAPARRQPQLAAPKSNNQYDVPNGQFQYEPSASNVQEYSVPEQRPTGIKNLSGQNQVGSPARYQFRGGPNVQDQYNEPGRNQFGAQRPQKQNGASLSQEDEDERNYQQEFGRRIPQSPLASNNNRVGQGSRKPPGATANKRPELNRFKDGESSTTDVPSVTEVDEPATVTALDDDESEQISNTKEFDEDVDGTPKTLKPVKLEDPQRGEYFIALPDGRLQRIRYVSRQDLEAMRYFAKIRAENVEPLRGPIYAYAPLQQIEVKPSSAPGTLNAAASEVKPQTVDVNGANVNAQYLQGNPAGAAAIPLNYPNLANDNAAAPSEERYIVTLP